jgi:hypothetical protein
VIKCSLVKKDSKGQSFIREKGKNFEIVILCIGSRDACNKRTALIEKTMETDANDYNSSSEDENNSNFESDDMSEESPKKNKKTQKRARLVNSSSYGSITNEYIKTTTTYTSAAPTEEYVLEFEETTDEPLQTQTGLFRKLHSRN